MEEKDVENSADEKKNRLKKFLIDFFEKKVYNEAVYWLIVPKMGKIA